MDTSNELIYDLIIVGAGPSGLALAQCCSKINQNILIIDRESDIGGCHRVRRVKYKDEYLFTEHGPRIYSSSYKVFISLLKEMNIDFNTLFTPYNFTISSIGGETLWTTLSYKELFQLFMEFIFLIINDKHGDDITMKEFTHVKKFKETSIDLIDKLCRLTDGATYEKYTLNEFLQLFNQQFFHKIYQPKIPNDKGLFKIWSDYLKKHNVDFLLSYNVEKLNIISDAIESVTVSNGNNVFAIKCKKVVMAIPPLSMIPFIDLFKSDNRLKEWAHETAYIDYISVTFHWDRKILLPKVYGFPKTSWGIAFIVLSDYMQFDESTSHTVISAAITITDKKSHNIHKTADQCDLNELISEIYNQLLESFPHLPPPTASMVSPGIYYDNNKWRSIDTAYISTLTTTKDKFLPFKSELVSNLYNVGTHNGKSRYKFTSLEAAVTNAVELSYILHPELKKIYTITSGYTVRGFIIIIIFIIIIYILYKSNTSKVLGIK
jgi:hypothetical protein